MLIDKYVKSKPQKRGNFPFSCFADFIKAFDCHGNFSLARQELRKVGLEALVKLRKAMGYHFYKNIKPTTELFDSLISPILLYCNEIWGIVCTTHPDKEPAELVQNKFLKWLFVVNKYGNNNACRSELNRQVSTVN